MRIGQRWPEDEMRKCEVIFVRSLDKAIKIAKKYGIGKMYLVGSSLHKEPEEA